MNSNKSLLGSLIVDNGNLGVIINEIKQGTWSEDPIFGWTTSYEIKYFDGTKCVMTSNSLERLIKKGKIKLLTGEEE